MPCHKARELIHQLLDGTLADHSGLDTHLAECETCREELARLERLACVLRAFVNPPADEAPLERVTSRILSAVEVDPTRRVAPPVAWLQPAAAALLLVGFALGLAAGRTAWARERVVTRVVAQPKVIRETVRKEVPVPVAKERVVIRRVPVTRTKVVYVNRPAPPPVELQVGAAYGFGRPAQGLRLTEGGPPVKLDEVIIRLDAMPLPNSPPVVSQELHGASAVDGEPAAHDGSPPRQGLQFEPPKWPGTPGARFAALGVARP